MSEECGSPRSGRSDGIDQFRGFLVLLVMFGHLFEITGQLPFVIWLGFGFRMPLFIGLSGYLFNLDRARAEPLLMLAQRYSRIVVPWLFACCVYLSLADPINWLAPLRMIFRPPYHLWFVPVMLAFIIACRASSLRPRYLLMIAFPISIASMIVFGIGHESLQSYDWVPDRRYFIFPLYFVLGLCVSRRAMRPDLTALFWAVSLFGGLWWAYLYGRPAPLQKVAAELVLCTPMIFLIPSICGMTIRLVSLRAIGRSSLFYYLWHPLMMALWVAAGASNILQILTLSLTSLAAVKVSVSRAHTLSNLLGIGVARKAAPRSADAPAVALAPLAAK